MTIPEHMLSLPAAASALPRRAAVLLKMLENIGHGRLDVRLPDGGHCCFGDDQAGPHAHIEISDWRLFDAVMARRRHRLGRELHAPATGQPRPAGAADAARLRNRRRAARTLVYGQLVRRRWRTACATWLHRNSRAGQPPEHPRPLRPGQRVLRPVAGRHDELLRRRCSRRAGAAAGARRSTRKCAAPARGCGVQPGAARAGDRLRLGRLRRVAAREFGAQVTGVTLSPAQLDCARQRLRRAGPGRRVELRLQDYRDVDGGSSTRSCRSRWSRRWASASGRPISARLRRLLKPGGRACMQTIMIADELLAALPPRHGLHPAARLPRRLLPCPSPPVAGHGPGAPGLALADSHAFGPDYARTLGRRVAGQWSSVKPESPWRWASTSASTRIWRFYLAYCEARGLRQRLHRCHAVRTAARIMICSPGSRGHARAMAPCRHCRHRRLRAAVPGRAGAGAARRYP